MLLALDPWLSKCYFLINHCGYARIEMLLLDKLARNIYLSLHVLPSATKALLYNVLSSLVNNSYEMRERTLVCLERDTYVAHVFPHMHSFFHNLLGISRFIEHENFRVAPVRVELSIQSRLFYIDRFMARVVAWWCWNKSFILIHSCPSTNYVFQRFQRFSTTGIHQL